MKKPSTAKVPTTHSMPPMQHHRPSLLSALLVVWPAILTSPSAVAQASATDGELWIATVRMSTLPGPQESRVCQRPPGEFEMPDIGQMPPDCRKSPIRRKGQQMSFDYECPQAKGTMEVQWVNPGLLEAVNTVQMRVQGMPPMKMTISARREGSCRLGAAHKR